MHTYPIFISLDLTGNDEQGLPFAIAWSLPNGQIKSTLIIPDEEWDLWEHGDPNVDIEQLQEMGASTIEIMQELANDIDVDSLYCFDDLLDHAALLKVFESTDSDIPYELIQWSTVLDPSLEQALIETADFIASQNMLNTEHAEDRVRMMLLSFNEVAQSARSFDM